MAIQPEFFRPGGGYKTAVDFLFSAIKGALPAHGTHGARIPGEPELEQRIIRERDGIPVDANTWAELLEVAASLNVSLNGEIAAVDGPRQTAPQ